MISILGITLAIGALVGHIHAQGFPFPCIIDPCEDDPTFLAFGAFSCNGPTGAVCGDAAALDACPLACLTCSPCQEPEAIPGFDAIVQSVAISDTQVAVQLLSSQPFAGAQFQTFCTLESGEEAFVEMLSGDGGIALGTIFGVSTGSAGKWLTLSLAAESIPPGFFLVTILETESQSAKGCKEGSINLQKGIIVDPSGTEISFCGGGDNPCPGVVPEPSSPPPPSPPPPGCAFTPGDVNGDGVASVLDLTGTTNFIAGLAELPEGAFCAADIDSNGTVDITDVIGIVSIIVFG